MRSSRRLDWMIWGLRWLLIAGAVIVLTLDNTILSTLKTPATTQLLTYGLIAAVAYNVIVGVLLLLGFAGNWLARLTLLGDSILTILFFVVSGNAPMILVGVGLFPIIVASLRYGRLAGLLMAAVISIGSVAVTAQMGMLSSSGPSLLIGIVFLFLTGVLTSLIGVDMQGTSGRQMTATDQEIEFSRLRAARERARAIYEMASTLGATLDYHAVMNAALDVGTLGLREMGPDVRLVGMVMLFENDELRVVTSRRLTRQDEKVTVPGRRGVLGLALKQAESVFASDAMRDPELNRFVAFQETKSILAIPLRAGFDNYGVLVFGTHLPDAFSDEHIELLNAIGTQATIALQNAVLYENLRQEKERIVEVEEDARKKLARDLHDGPTQVVSAIAMRVGYIRKLMEKNQLQTITEELMKVEEMARNTTKDIRHMLFTLRPLVLETQGLSPALQQFAEKMKETHNLDVTLQLQPGVDSLIDSHAQGILFYIIEEAVNNARKHAQAEHHWVRLYRRDNHLITEIQDDGVGFDVGSVDAGYEKRGSLGMVNMRERAALIEGRLSIESAKGQGTKISIVITLKNSPQTGSVGKEAQSDRRATLASNASTSRGQNK